MPTTTTSVLPLQTLLLVAAVAMLSLGLVLLKAGGFPRRRGAEPHCRRCGYDVTGNVSGRCPECGANLAARRAVVTGVRRRRALVMLLGLALTLGGLAISSPRAYQKLASVEWYQRVPAFWVFRELNAQRAGVPTRAFDELKRRWGAGELDEARRRALVDLLLQSELDESLTELKAKDDAFKFLFALARADELSSEQRERFFRQIGEPVLTVRPRVRYDERVPWRVSAARSRAGRQLWWLSFEVEDVTVDGVPAAWTQGLPPPGPDLTAGITSLADEPTQSTAGSLAVQREGRHTLAMQVSVQLLDLRTGGALRRLYARTFPLSAPFEVAPQGTDPVRVLENPAIVDALHASISIPRLTVDAGRGQLRLPVAIKNLPADIGFYVLLRSDDGKERKLGVLVHPKNTSTEQLLWTAGTLDPAPPSARIVLRSDPYLVRRTLDQFELWKGELVYDAVPVTATRR